MEHEDCRIRRAPARPCARDAVDAAYDLAEHDDHGARCEALFASELQRPGAPTVGGIVFGFQWNMGWMNDTLVYFSKDPVHRRYHHPDPGGSAAPGRPVRARHVSEIVTWSDS